MIVPRTLPLLDLQARPQSWNERIVGGEFAVLYSGIPENAPFDANICMVFESLQDAEQYAAQQVALYPELRCRIYDHHGLGAQPIREYRGNQHKGDSEISSRMRRWGGSVLLFGGVFLWTLDAMTDFRRMWPSTVGVRMAPVGLILLLTELVIVIEARRVTKASR